MTKGIRLNTAGKVDRPNIAEDKWTSEAVSPKVRLPGSGSITTDSSGNGSTVIPHNLGYSPIVLGYYSPIKVDSALYDATRWGFMDNNYFGIDPDSNNITINISGAQANTVYRFFFYLFVEPNQ